MRLQSILTNTTDYAMDEERSEILAMAKAQLESLMEKCGLRPRADKEATATIDLPHGRTVSISTGMSEVEYTGSSWGQAPRKPDFSVLSRCRTRRHP